MDLKKVFGNLKNILIVVLIIIILLMRACSGNSTPKQGKTKIVTETKTEYVTVEKKVNVYVPKIVRVTKVEWLPSESTPIDTADILSEYYAQNEYSDTLSLDTLGYVVINDVITQNQISSRDFTYKLDIPKVTTTTTITEYINRRELYYGFGMAGNMSQLNYVGAELMYKNKKKQAYGLGVGINQNLQPIISGRIYWKIGK